MYTNSTEKKAIFQGTGQKKIKKNEKETKTLDLKEFRRYKFICKSGCLYGENL
jgi:hypothetical protein